MFDPFQAVRLEFRGQRALLASGWRGLRSACSGGHRAEHVSMQVRQKGLEVQALQRPFTFRKGYLKALRA